MYKTVKFLTLVTVLFSLFTTVNSASAAENAKHVNLAASAWPPYVDKNALEQGAATDLVRQIFKRAGYETTVKIESWPRTLEGVKIGIYDVIVASWHTSEREQSLSFSQPYFQNVIRLVQRKGSNIRFQNYNDLKGLVIGIVNGYAYGDEFLNAPGLIRVPKNHVLQNLLLLKQGRIDLAIGDQWVVRNELTQYFPSAIKNFEFTGKAVARRNLHIAVSKSLSNHKEIVSDFNAALKTMKNDGSFEKIISKHRDNLVKLTEAPL